MLSAHRWLLYVLRHKLETAGIEKYRKTPNKQKIRFSRASSRNFSCGTTRHPIVPARCGTLFFHKFTDLPTHKARHPVGPIYKDTASSSARNSGRESGKLRGRNLASLLRSPATFRRACTLIPKYRFSVPPALSRSVKTLHSGKKGGREGWKASHLARRL